MTRRWQSALLAIMSIAVPISVWAAPPGFARTVGFSSTVDGETIDAVVVKSWGGCNGGGLIWDSLNANWPNYGSIPIAIDYDHPGLCGHDDEVTLAKLEATDAEALIISDPSGNFIQFNATEARALKEYALEGNNLIGTFLLFRYQDTDNRVLAPLFGVKPRGLYLGGDDEIVPTYVERYPGLPLFDHVGNPYLSSGFPFSQTPDDGAWSSNELTRARLVARTSDSNAGILVKPASADSPYWGIYVSSMPEYGGSMTDEQFFYNALIFPGSE